jgi:hypothetical protein
MDLILEPEQFIEIFSEFALMDRESILWNLKSAHQKCGRSTWCDIDGRREAIALLTAHWLALSLYQKGAIASVAVESVAGKVMSLPKMEGLKDGGEFGSTIYGQRYLNLWRSLPKTGFVV